MIEKINTKTITSKVVAFLFIIFFLVIFPPFSVSFLCFALSFGIITIFSMIYSVKQRNAAVYLIYYLGTNTLLCLFGLRFWNLFIGLSYKIIASLIPGFLFAALFPFFNKVTSESLYQMELKLNRKSILMFLLIGVANVIVINILWKTLGVKITGNLSSTIIISFLCYIVAWVTIHSGFHMFMSGRFQNWLDHL